MSLTLIGNCSLGFSLSNTSNTSLQHSKECFKSISLGSEHPYFIVFSKTLFSYNAFCGKGTFHNPDLVFLVLGIRINLDLSVTDGSAYSNIPCLVSSSLTLICRL